MNIRQNKPKMKSNTPYYFILSQSLFCIIFFILSMLPAHLLQADCAESTLNILRSIMQDVREASENTDLWEEFYFLDSNLSSRLDSEAIRNNNLILIGDKHTDYQGQVKIFGLLSKLNLSFTNVYWEGVDENSFVSLRQIALESLYLAYMASQGGYCWGSDEFIKIAPNALKELDECVDQLNEELILPLAKNARSWQRAPIFSQQSSGQSLVPNKREFEIQIQRTNRQLSSSIMTSLRSGKKTLVLCGIGHIPFHPALIWAKKNQQVGKNLLLVQQEEVLQEILSEIDSLSSDSQHPHIDDTLENNPHAISLYHSTVPVLSELKRSPSFMVITPGM